MKWKWVCLFFVIFTACRNEIQKSKPEDYFTKSQTESLLHQIVKKTSKKPESSFTESEKETYYQQVAKTYQWHFAHQENGGYYFLVSRPAPSLYGKRTAIAGFFRSVDGMQIQGFKEEFHLFKMKPDKMLEKGSLLFEKMVNREDLSLYYPQNQKNDEEWIEFPDALNQYDSATQEWKTKGL
jgi:hypothetical protein